MARRRTEKETASPNIRLKQPNRSAPDPNHETLLDIANKRGLLKESDKAVENGNNTTSEEDNNPPIGRLGEAILWSISLAMVHLTFDLLVQHQYAVAISWTDIALHSVQAFGSKSFPYHLTRPS
jgi:hypothetical protein